MVWASFAAAHVAVDHYRPSQPVAIAVHASRYVDDAELQIGASMRAAGRSTRAL